MAANGTASQGMAAYRAPSLFQPHKARQALRDAHEKKIPPILGYYAGLSCVPIIRFLAPMGFDSVWIDWEHSSCNVETMTDMVHEAIFMSEGRTMPFVRVPGHDHAAIGYALDAGASIIVPQVETVEQAKHVISSAKFGTKQRGTRSAPPFRLIPGLTDLSYDSSLDFHKAVNNQAAIMIQVESLEAINNLDAILTECPDIDCVWLGSLDARVSMNLPGNFGQGTEPEWLAALEKYNEVMAKHNKPKGSFALLPPFGTAENIKEKAKELSYMMVTADVAQLMGMAQQLVECRGLAALPEMNGVKKDVVNGVVETLEKTKVDSVE